MEEDVIDLAIAPGNELARLEQWATARSIDLREFLGPGDDSSELDRTKNKIHKEQEQLPLDRPGAIVVFNNRLFFKTPDILLVIRQLEEFIYDYAHISLFVVIGQWFGQER